MEYVNTRKLAMGWLGGLKGKREQGNGDCYKIAADMVMDRRDGSLLLCHGNVDGQGPLAGCRFGHAWVEEDEMLGAFVIDHSNGKRVVVPAILYYAVGNINENEVRRYTREEAGKKMLKFEIYGPWH